MTRFLLAGLAAAAMVMVASTAAAQDQALIEKGMQVYTQQKCSLCHAVDGKGNAQGPLDGVGTKLTADEIKAWIVTPREMTEKTGATRRPNMRAYPNLEEADLDALIAYLVSLKDK
jgi:cytochrome c oxidase subunit 2